MNSKQIAVTLTAAFFAVFSLAILTLIGVVVSMSHPHSQSETRAGVTWEQSNAVSTPVPTAQIETLSYKKGYALGSKHGQNMASTPTSGIPTILSQTAKWWHDGTSEYSSLPITDFQLGYESGFQDRFKQTRAKLTDHVSSSRLTFINVWRIKEGTPFYDSNGTRVGTAWTADTYSGAIEYCGWLTGQVITETDDVLKERHWRMLK